MNNLGLRTLAILLGFACVTGLSYWILSGIGSKRSRVLERLDWVSRHTAAAAAGTSGGPGVDALDDTTGAGGSRETRLVAVFRSLASGIGRVFEKRSVTRKLDWALDRAGIPLKGSEFLGAAILLPAAAAGAYLVVAGEGAFGLLVVTAGAALFPWIYLNQARKKRLRKFDSQISECLVLMSNSLKAGYSFLHAMELVSSEMPAPISDEFGRTLKEMNLGADSEEALQSLAERVGSDDLDLVITAVLIQRQVGGNLSEVLDNISFTIRERARIRGEIRTLTAQGRISGMIIAALPLFIAILVGLLNPGYASLLVTHPLGRAMLGLAIAGEIVGALTIRKIVDIEV